MLIIIDCNNLCYRAKFAMGHLSHEDQQTGVIFGFLLRVLELSEVFSTNRFVFAWDSKKSLRAVDYEGYKSKRKKNRLEKTEEEQELDRLAYEQFDLIRKEILFDMGFKNVYMETGYEADDIIANVVQNSIPDEHIGLYTTDRDLCQLLSENVFIINSKPKKKKGGWGFEGVYAKEDFIAEWGITPNRWAEVLSIAGCDTDEVVGIKGVGKKTAINYLLALDGVNGSIERLKAKFKKIYGNPIIDINRPLVTLPFSGMDRINIDYDFRLKVKNVEKVFKRFGFMSFLGPMWGSWKKQFNL
jgi:5'-3' exonuclease